MDTIIAAPCKFCCVFCIEIITISIDYYLNYNLLLSETILNVVNMT